MKPHRLMEVLECLSELEGASPKLVDVDSAFTPKNYPEKSSEILGGRSPLML